jgi:speckle-type POZ protein
MPKPTQENVCELLMLADLHGAQMLKRRAAAFIRAHTEQVMGTKGWLDGVSKQPELVKFLISSSFQ